MISLERVAMAVYSALAHVFLQPTKSAFCLSVNPPRVNDQRECGEDCECPRIELWASDRPNKHKRSRKDCAPSHESKNHGYTSC